MTEAEFNAGKEAFINMLTPKFKEQTQVVSNITPIKLKNLGEPAFGQTVNSAVMSDVRKKANPQSSDTYTVGATYPTRFSDRFK